MKHCVSDSLANTVAILNNRYYIRIANQLLVEDDDEGEGKGFVMLTADINVRLVRSLKERGERVSTYDIMPVRHHQPLELEDRNRTYTCIL